MDHFMCWMRLKKCCAVVVWRIVSHNHLIVLDICAANGKSKYHCNIL